jgi:hypothetical protein
MRDQNSSLYYHLADAIAFWIWQMTPTIKAWCQVSDTLPDEIVIGVQIENPDEFFDASSSDDFGIETAVSANQISVSFNSSFALSAAANDNQAERDLARRLLTDVASCLQFSASSSEIDEAIDLHAPRGLKRRMKTLSAADAAIMDGTGLPRSRRIQRFEQERIRDEVGEIAEKHANDGRPLNTKESHAIHQDIVKEMYSRLEDEVAQFDDTVLLPTLIARHEALIAERRRTESIVGSHLSAMGDSLEERKRLQNEFVEIDKASTASRFLLEYVSARPPSGSKVLSTTSYDRLLAIAAEIIESGYLSDGLHREVSEIELQMAPSKRLKFGASVYADAVTKFQDEFYNAKADASLATKDVRADRGGADQKRDDQDIEQLIDDAAVAEFGLRLEDIGAVIGRIVHTRFTNANGLGRAQSAELIDFLEEACDVSRNSITQLLEQFTGSCPFCAHGGAG